MDSLSRPSFESMSKLVTVDIGCLVLFELRVNVVESACESCLLTVLRLQVSLMETSCLGSSRFELTRRTGRSSPCCREVSRDGLAFSQATYHLPSNRRPRDSPFLDASDGFLSHLSGSSVGVGRVSYPLTGFVLHQALTT
jgi:hypothetical protein